MFKKLVEEFLSVEEINNIIEKFTKGIPLGYEVNIPISRQNADTLYEEFGEDDIIIVHNDGNAYVQLKAICKHETVLNGVTISTLSKDGVCALCGITKTNIETNTNSTKQPMCPVIIDLRQENNEAIITRMKKNMKWLCGFLHAVNKEIKNQLDAGVPHNLLRMDRLFINLSTREFPKYKLDKIFGRPVLKTKIMLLNNCNFVKMCSVCGIVPNTMYIRSCSIKKYLFSEKYSFIKDVLYNNILPFSKIATVSANMANDYTIVEFVVHKKSQYGDAVKFIDSAKKCKDFVLTYDSEDFCVFSVSII